MPLSTEYHRIYFGFERGKFLELVRAHALNHTPIKLTIDLVHNFNLPRRWQSNFRTPKGISVYAGIYRN